MNPELANSDTWFLETYGLYLMNGGTPEGFMNLTMDDVNIMHASYLAVQKNNTKDILEGIVRIVNKIAGGDE